MLALQKKHNIQLNILFQSVHREFRVEIIVISTLILEICLIVIISISLILILELLKQKIYLYTMIKMYQLLLIFHTNRNLNQNCNNKKTLVLKRVVKIKIGFFQKLDLHFNKN